MGTLGSSMYSSCGVTFQGYGNTIPDLSDLVPFHSGQVTCPESSINKNNSILYFNWISYFKLACCLENSADPDFSEAS